MLSIINVMLHIKHIMLYINIKNIYIKVYILPKNLFFFIFEASCCPWRWILCLLREKGPKGFNDGYSSCFPSRITGELSPALPVEAWRASGGKACENMGPFTWLSFPWASHSHPTPHWAASNSSKLLFMFSCWLTASVNFSK